MHHFDAEARAPSFRKKSSVARSHHSPSRRLCLLAPFFSSLWHLQRAEPKRWLKWSVSVHLGWPVNRISASVRLAWTACLTANPFGQVFGQIKIAQKILKFWKFWVCSAVDGVGYVLERWACGWPRWMPHEQTGRPSIRLAVKLVICARCKKLSYKLG
jgi:hypothetical protein